MAVPNNPSLQDLVNEFGGPGDLRSYYRGGPYVPNVLQNIYVGADPNSLDLLMFPGSTRAIPMSVAISPNPMGSNQGTAVITGGIAPYTYLWQWSQSSGNLVGSIYPNTNSYAKVTVSGRGNAAGTVTLTVTDSVGTTASASATANAVGTG